MGLPVVTVASGGLPVVEAVFGTPVTEATNGRGVPVTKVIGKPGLPVTFVADGAAAFVAASFDGTNTLVVLSNGNRTVTHNNTTNSAGAVSTAFRSSGKYYFEATLQNSVSTNNMVGVITSAFTGVFGSATLTSTGGTGLNLGTGTALTSNGINDTVGSFGAQAVNDVYSFAIDLTARLAWARKNGGNWNNSGTANPATGTGGAVMNPTLTFTPYVRFQGAITTTDAIAANFGTTAFVSAVPPGFTAGWPA